MKLTKEELHDKLASIQNRQYDHQLTIHDAIQEHYQLISDIIDSIVPQPGELISYTSKQDTFGQGYSRAIDTIRRNAKELLGVQ